jgi:ABC-type amino acid transport substrate-binding protein
VSPASPDRTDRPAAPDVRRRTALAGALLGAVPIGTRADAPRSGLALDDAQRAWIAARPVVRWTAIFEARPYLAYRGGPPEGLVVDILKRVTASTGLRFEYLPSATHGEGFGRLRNGGVDLLPMLGTTPERRREFAFTEPYARYALGIFTRRRYSYLESPADLAGLKVGVPAGLDSMLLEASPQAVPVRFEDVADGVRALSARHIDALVAPVPVVRHWILKLGADELWMQAVLPVQASLGMAALPSAAPLIGVLDAVLRRIHAPERRELIDAWTEAGPEWPGRLAGPTATVVLAAAAGTGWWLYRRRALPGGSG